MDKLIIMGKLEKRDRERFFYIDLEEWKLKTEGKLVEGSGRFEPSPGIFSQNLATSKLFFQVLDRGSCSGLPDL